jgi:hypothetical protein
MNTVQRLCDNVHWYTNTHDTVNASAAYIRNQDPGMGPEGRRFGRTSVPSKNHAFCLARRTGDTSPMFGP